MQLMLIHEFHIIFMSQKSGYFISKNKRSKNEKIEKDYTIIAGIKAKTLYRTLLILLV